MASHSRIRKCLLRKSMDQVNRVQTGLWPATRKHAELLPNYDPPKYEYTLMNLQHKFVCIGNRTATRES